MPNSRGLCLFLLLLSISHVKGRLIELSDGVNDVNNRIHQIFPLLSNSISDPEGSSTLYAGEKCHRIYRFMPCSNTMVEGFFLTAMYTCLLILGEEWLNQGSKAVLINFGHRSEAGSVFRVLMSLPRVIIIFVSGVLFMPTDAPYGLAFGAAMYAGSTVMSLTGIWGINVILRKEKLSRTDPSRRTNDSSQTSVKLNHTHVRTYKDTRNMASIMLLSLIPFIFILLVDALDDHLTTLFGLIASALSLISYITYQIVHPRTRNKSLAYLKEEQLRAKLLKKLSDLTEESLYLQDIPNKEAIRSIFSTPDLALDELTHERLENLIIAKLGIGEDEVSREYAIEEIFIHFDGKAILSKKDFEDGTFRWLEKWSSSSDSDSDSQNLWDKVLIEHGIAELNKAECVMPRILYKLLKKKELVIDDGDIEDNILEGLFDRYSDKEDILINMYELERIISNPSVDVNNVNLRSETRKNGYINKNEFVKGMQYWFRRAKRHASGSNDLETTLEHFGSGEWGPVKEKGVPKVHIIFKIFIGLVTICLFAAPFIQSAVYLSSVTHVPILFTAFAVAPLLLKAKEFLRFLCYPARKNISSKNASLFFSELYSELAMTNILGLTTLLAIVYTRSLTWDYSHELVTIVTISGIQGIFALTCLAYPLWWSIVSFFLYGMTILLYTMYVSARA